LSQYAGHLALAGNRDDGEAQVHQTEFLYLRVVLTTGGCLLRQHDDPNPVSLKYTKHGTNQPTCYHYQRSHSWQKTAFHTIMMK
jgi:hypothetical protein